MKVRIFLTVMLLTIWGWFINGIVAPVGVIAKNTAVVATVNGGNEEYVAQNALNESFKYGPLVSIVIVLALLFVIWYGQFSSKNSK